MSPGKSRSTSVARVVPPPRRVSEDGKDGNKQKSTKKPPPSIDGHDVSSDGLGTQPPTSLHWGDFFGGIIMLGRNTYGCFRKWFGLKPPKSSILVGVFHYKRYPFWGTPHIVRRKTHPWDKLYIQRQGGQGSLPPLGYMVKKQPTNIFNPRVYF